MNNSTNETKIVRQVTIVLSFIKFQSSANRASHKPVNKPDKLPDKLNARKETRGGKLLKAPLENSSRGRLIIRRNFFLLPNLFTLHS